MIGPAARSLGRLFRAVIIAAIAVLAGASCSLLTGRPFAVVAWKPGTGYHPDPDGIGVSLTFSNAPDRVSVENAFRLVGEGETLDGLFSWDGSTLYFRPNARFAHGADFLLSVSIEAMDRSGLSLPHPFEARFSTRSESVRPTVSSTLPLEGGSLDSAWSAIEVLFSEPVDPLSFRDSVSFSPVMVGSWDFMEANAVFRPAQPWQEARKYEVKISAGLKDLQGNRMGSEYGFGFFSGPDSTPPTLCSASAIDVDGTVAAALGPDAKDDAEYALNGGWEAPWRLRLIFSEPVRLSSLIPRIIVDGCSPLVSETAAELSDVVVLRFTAHPAWGGLFSVRIREGYLDAWGNAARDDVVYRIQADGPCSRPPRWIGFRMPLAPGEADIGLRELAAFPVDEPYSALVLEDAPGRYPFGVPVPTSFELYLELAEGAGPDLFSIMEHFRLAAAGGVLDFSPRLVAKSGFGYVEPYSPWQGHAVVRIDGMLTNRADPGLVTISLGAGLSDSRGNRIGEAIVLPLVK